MRKKFLKVSVLLKGTIATSVRMPTFLSSWTNVSQEILETDESGFYVLPTLYKGGCKQIQIKPCIKPISAFMIPIGWLVIPQCGLIFD